MSSRPSRSVIARVAFLFAAIGGLAACGPGPSPDIKAELARAREGQRGRVEPLPQVPPYELPVLRIERDPFARR